MNEAIPAAGLAVGAAPPAAKAIPVMKFSPFLDVCIERVGLISPLAAAGPYPHQQAASGPGILLSCPMAPIIKLLTKSTELVTIYGGPHIPHQLTIVVQVVQTVQLTGQNLVALK